MAWMPIVKTLGPFVIQLGEIGVRALPHFTSRKSEAPVEIEDRVTQKQISELQSAATENAQYIRELASELKSAITVVDGRLRRLALLVYFALGLSIISSIGVLVLWLR
jgi:hypothetical protein